MLLASEEPLQHSNDQITNTINASTSTSNTESNRQPSADNDSSIRALVDLPSQELIDQEVMDQKKKLLLQKYS